MLQYFFDSSTSNFSNIAINKFSKLHFEIAKYLI